MVEKKEKKEKESILKRDRKENDTNERRARINIKDGDREGEIPREAGQLVHHAHALRTHTDKNSSAT